MSDIYLHSDLDYSGLLNTHLSPFSYGGKEYRTAEHLFQALKVHHLLSIGIRILDLFSILVH